MTSHRSRDLDLLAPALGAPTVAPSREHGRLRDDEAQLARMDLSLAQAEWAGAAALVRLLSLLRQAQLGKVLEARRMIGERPSFRDFLVEMRGRIVAMGFGGGALGRGE